MEVLRIIITVLEVIASLLLIVVVLFQSGKESGLSGALAGKNETFMAKNGKGGLDKMLASATKWIAIAWVALTAALSLLP